MELTSDECKLILHCIHNARWMSQNESAMIAVDPHIWVLRSDQVHRLEAMLPRLVEATGDSPA